MVKTPQEPTSEILEAIEKIAMDAQKKAGTLTVCETVALTCQDQYGWCVDYGAYDGPEVRKRGRRRFQYRHYYNRLPDGTIVDTTARQFGDQRNVRVIPHDDPRQNHYVTIVDEWDGQVIEMYGIWDDGHPVADFYLQNSIEVTNLMDYDD